MPSYAIILRALRAAPRRRCKGHRLGAALRRARRHAAHGGGAQLGLRRGLASCQRGFSDVEK